MGSQRARLSNGQALPPFVCDGCKKADCNNCIDVLRSVLNLAEMCKCSRQNHDGEPAAQQIEDPFTGDIHAPGLVVKSDGGGITRKPLPEE